MSTPDNERQYGTHGFAREHSTEESVEEEPFERTDHRPELSALVDDLEDQITAERELQDVPGNAAERADTIAVETGEAAPD
ncbi:hypothetical protein P3H15_49770 [Rhodococcus sp. T2V]|uniref:hypothetical protein n=1 Tax=Rhodococcus sp. T2V TaxID=3034164 RepID=UPI0023E3002A|nr:hypothetical protein [Rhodococcus sp. T2V]MDF3313015.1 hypothetical protein [Rhodococcus sp. T2V]